MKERIVAMPSALACALFSRPNSRCSFMIGPSAVRFTPFTSMPWSVLKWATSKPFS